MTNAAAQGPDEDGWFVSSFTTAGGICVQVKFTEQGTILIRDSKDRGTSSPIITMSSSGWASLLQYVNLPF